VGFEALIESVSLPEELQESESLDEEPDSLLELLELLLSLFLHAASFSILRGGWLETEGSFPPTMSTSSSICRSPVIMSTSDTQITEGNHFRHQIK
jgi:hypothetical protein